MLNKHKIPPISILIPVYNENLVIEQVLLNYLDVLSHLPSGSAIEIEDGGSTDGTVEILRRFSQADSRVTIAYRNNKDGFNNAVIRLIDSSINSWVFVSDSDGQYDPYDLLKILEHFDSDIPLYKGIKHKRSDGLARKLLSKILNLYVSYLFRVNYSDVNSSHFLLNKTIIPSNIKLISRFRHHINIEIFLLIISQKNAVVRIPISHVKRQYGFSRGNAPTKLVKISFETFVDVFRFYRKSI